MVRYCKYFCHNSKKKKRIFYCDGDWKKERINDNDWWKYYFIIQIYYFNEQNMKIKDWDAGRIVKQNGIVDKIAF